MHEQIFEKEEQRPKLLLLTSDERVGGFLQRCLSLEGYKVEVISLSDTIMLENYQNTDIILLDFDPELLDIQQLFQEYPPLATVPLVVLLPLQEQKSAVPKKEGVYILVEPFRLHKALELLLSLLPQTKRSVLALNKYKRSYGIMLPTGLLDFSPEV